MTLQVGDKAVVIPLRDGGRVTVRSGTLSVGDKAVLVPGANGQIYAVRPASPQVGDKVILYPLRNGGHVCLASADADDGGSSPSVMPPGNFDALRTGPGTASLKWLPGEGNTAVRIVRRSDRYPTHINDGTVAYEGAGREATDIGLDFRLPYYYCAWGKAGSKYSNGYLMGWIQKWGTQSSPVHVCDAWGRRVTKPGEVVSYGPFRYYWDGEGKVYLSASPTAVQAVTVDDGPVVITAKGEINRVGATWSGILEITPLLGIGANDIWVDVRDNPSHALSIGPTTPLYIMRSL
jgi:hypothetical protein